MDKTDIFSFFKRKKNEKQMSSLVFTEYLDYASHMSREIYLTSVTPQIAETIVKTIKMWNDVDDESGVELSNRPPIKIYINSTGGNFEAMLTIMDIIKMSKTPVHTINMGIVQNEAFFVYIAGHNRYTFQKATFLYKQDLKSLSETDPSMNNYVLLYEKQLLELKEILMERTKISETEYNKHSKHNWWLNAEEAQRLRISNEMFLSLYSK